MSWRLTLEEAFLLSHALRCLELRRMGEDGEAGEVLEGEEAWRAFAGLRPKFPRMYVALYHFVSKGWFVRSGLAYGCDYVLYEKHPEQAHSRYGVFIMPETTKTAFSWVDYQVCSRGAPGALDSGRVLRRNS